MPMQHKLELWHNGQKRFGLRRGNASLSMESIAHPFSFTYAEKITATDPIALIRRGDEVRIIVDDEPLVGGYVNQSVRRHTVDELTFEVRGRSYGQDLVDCSAVVGKRYERSATADKLIEQIAKPFGLATRMAPGATPGAIIKGFKIEKGAKAFDAIMQACTKRGLWPRILPIEPVLELARADATPEYKALANGENCTEMDFEENDEQLFSAYLVHGRTSETDDAYGGATRIRGQVNDPSVTRYRPLRLETKGGDGPDDVGQRAKIERNRRLGNSEVIHCRTDGWRDGPVSDSGIFWLPNQLRVCIDPEPAMQIDSVQMLITSVKYEWDDAVSKGFTCALELKRREAFDPEAAYPVTQVGALVTT
jgi:prophage tail gpP-like protein